MTTRPHSAPGALTATTVVARVDPRAVDGWDDRVAALGGSVFHTIAWARVLAETYGYEPVYHTLDGAGVRAILPVMEVRSWLTGRRGISLPFTDECAALGADPGTYRRLFDAAVAFGRSRGWRYLECRGSAHLRPDAPPSLAFHGHRLNLDQAEAELQARLDSSTRRAIRKARASGLSVEFTTSPGAMGEFYRLLMATRRRHGLPPQPARFFSAIQAHLIEAGRGTLVLARHQGRAVAGAVYLHSGRTVLYKFGASDERFQHLRGNNLVMWEAIGWHAQRGFTLLDFGRTSLANEGLRRFKLSWGAHEHTARYIKFDLRAGAFVADRDHASGWHNQVFRLLPGPLARLTGTLLYRHIA